MRSLPIALLVLSPAVWGGTPPPSAAPPDKTAQTAPAPDPMAFARGARAWAQSCSRCHAMRDPKEATDRQWPVITTHMRVRAGLDGAQVRDITVFLQGSN